MQSDNKSAETIDETLNLRSDLSEIAKVHQWTGRLAVLNSISADVQFAIDLCLEEVLSNIIRHGYNLEKDRPLTLRFSAPRKSQFVFEIEDEAPPFNPLYVPEMPPLNAEEPIWVGGQGIRLLRRFADALEYEPITGGNRLRLYFLALRPTA